MHAQFVGNIRGSQERLLWKLFIRDASSKCAQQPYARGWELLRDCNSILVKMRHSFARRIIWWERTSEEMIGTSYRRARGRKDNLWDIES